MQTKLTLLSALILIHLLSCSSYAADPAFQAIPPEVRQKYHFDFGRLFFATSDVEKEERKQYEHQLSQLEQFKGKTITSPDNLLAAMKDYDECLRQFMKHYIYFYLHAAVDAKDEVSSEQASLLDAEFSKKTAFLQTELTTMDDTTLRTFVKKEPTLEQYSFAIQSYSRFRPYTLSLPQEEILSDSSPLISNWPFDLYQKLLSNTRFADVKSNGESWNVRSRRADIAVSPDRNLRKEGFQKLYEGYASNREFYAFTLLKSVAAQNKLAVLRHFKNAPDQVYFNSYWNPEDVRQLLERIATLASVYKHYQQIRAGEISKRFGYPDVNLWDLTASAPGGSVPRFNIDQASSIIREALAPLGDEYGRQLSLLLNPANGRMDIVPGDNRQSGGFSEGFPGIPSVFFSSGFEGYYNDMRILTHESTHAIHRQLMNENSVQPVYAEGPHFLFESFAIFNEFLLPDYLHSKEKDPLLRSYFLEQFLDGKGTALFYAAQDAMLEQALYEELDKLQSADDLDFLTQKISDRFSIWPAQHKELRMRWITNSLFYEDPLYNINYVYGSLLALKYYQLLLKDPHNFVPRYIGLMKNGFDVPPSVLLKKFLGIDMNDPQILSDAVNLIAQKVSQLEHEYAVEPSASLPGN